jgi:transposase-like protein
MRSKKEIRDLVEEFAKSGLTRREYCAKYDIAVTALDYWRRAHRKQKPTLMPVAIEEAHHRLAAFALVLANGRRIESSWSFAEADLKKLIRAAEA